MTQFLINETALNFHTIASDFDNIKLKTNSFAWKIYVTIKNSSKVVQCLTEQRFVHSVQQSFRKADVNAPRYAITPELTKTSPVRLSYTSCKWIAAADHLCFSPPKPPINFSARSNFFAQRSTWKTVFNSFGKSFC